MPTNNSEPAQHTPGPWTANGTQIDAEVDGQTLTIAGTRNDRQGEANARLIAAAPELLAALQDLMPLLQTLRDNLRALGRNDLLNDLQPGRIHAARAAITKATQP